MLLFLLLLLLLFSDDSYYLSLILDCFLIYTNNHHHPRGLDLQQYATPTYLNLLLSFPFFSSPLLELVWSYFYFFIFFLPFFSFLLFYYYYCSLVHCSSFLPFLFELLLSLSIFFSSFII